MPTKDELRELAVIFLRQLAEDVENKDHILHETDSFVVLFSKNTTETGGEQIMVYTPNLTDEQVSSMVTHAYEELDTPQIRVCSCPDCTEKRAKGEMVTCH